MAIHILIPLAAIVALSGCEDLLETLDDSKLFVVVKENPATGPMRKPNISTVLLVPNGNILEVGQLASTSTEIYPNAFVQEAGQTLHLSPRAEYIGLTQPDASNTENNIGIYLMPNGQSEYGGSDNTLSMEMERVCNNGAVLNDIYGGPPNWGPGIVNYRIEFEDDIANEISIVGWTLNSEAVVRWVAILKVLADETNPDGSSSTISAFEPADFYMTMRRTATRDWRGEDCFGDLPLLANPLQTTPVVPAPVSGVLVNGVPKDGAKPFGKVVEVYGPY